MVVITAEARFRELQVHLDDSSITTEEMDEMLDLMGMLG
jgi:hypothetical protein